MKYAQVKYKSNYQTYEFMTDLDLQKGDTVVCDSSNGYQVGEVLDVVEKPSHKKVHKWIVDKVDVTNHKIRLEKEKKLKEIKGRMEQRRKQLEEAHVYRLLAQEDEEMAKLLSEYENMN